MSDLAVFGGEPVIEGPLAAYPSLGRAEEEAVLRVIRSGRLSGFFGSFRDEYWGGPEVRRFEAAWAERFGVGHAVSVNSASSGLVAAMAAIGLGPGDQVIVPPLTMSATVMAPLMYGAVPVFADIEPETFGLDPEAVRRAVTERTKAILAVNLFGHPARLDELMAVAREHGLYLIEDNAQAPLAEDQGRLAGTIGHIGVFSLNFHKHIHTGEGGMCLTDDETLALRLKLVRNHGENAVESLGIEDITNLVGGNWRLTELQAAVGLAQLTRMDERVAAVERLAERLTRGVADLAGLIPPAVRPGCRHVYYVWTMRLDEAALGVSRQAFCRALAAEGFPHGQGYVRPLYLLPAFQQRRAIGAEGFPFNLAPEVSYAPGLCPVAERMYERELVLFETCAYDVDDAAADRLVECLRKVHAGRDRLAGREGES